MLFSYDLRYILVFDLDVIGRGYDSLIEHLF